MPRVILYLGPLCEDCIRYVIDRLPWSPRTVVQCSQEPPGAFRRDFLRPRRVRPRAEGAVPLFGSGAIRVLGVEEGPGALLDDARAVDCIFIPAVDPQFAADAGPDGVARFLARLALDRRADVVCCLDAPSAEDAARWEEPLKRAGDDAAFVAFWINRRTAPLRYARAEAALIAR